MIRRRASHDRLHSAGRCEQYMAQRAASGARVVESKGHSIQSDYFEGATVDFQIRIEVGARIHDSPKLALAWRDLNLRPDYAVNGKYPLRLFGVVATRWRLHSDLVHQHCSLRSILVEFHIAQHHDPFLHSPEFREITVNAFHHNGSGHSVQILAVTLHMLMGVVPVEARRLIVRYFHCVSERLPRGRRHSQDIVLRLLGRHMQAVEVKVGPVGAGHHDAFLFGIARQPVDVLNMDVLAWPHPHDRGNVVTVVAKLRFAGERIRDGFQCERSAHLRKFGQSGGLCHKRWG